MTPSRAPQGRGRPTVFDQAAREEYLRLIASGARLQDAAAMVGVNRRTPNQHASRDPQFASRLEDAKAAGVQALYGTPPDPDTTEHVSARLIPLPAPDPEPGETENFMLAEVS